jgi:hypothetical protein
MVVYVPFRTPYPGVRSETNQRQRYLRGEWIFLNRIPGEMVVSITGELDGRAPNSEPVFSEFGDDEPDHGRHCQCAECVPERVLDEADYNEDSNDSYDDNFESIQGNAAESPVVMETGDSWESLGVGLGRVVYRLT